MFDPNDSDTVSLEGYPFAWRWTGENHANISEEMLARIQPLNDKSAGEAWQHAMGIQGMSYQEQFTETHELEVDRRGADEPEHDVGEWLKARLPDHSDPIFVSWTERMAAKTDRETFIQHWNTFCYPVEDVVIWPQNEQWVLLFDYKQRFYFAVSNPAAP